MAEPRLEAMEFRRIHELPPYVFATVDQLKRELRREGRDVIDLGFGNPDIPSPAIAVDKLAEAAQPAGEPPLLRLARAAEPARRDLRALCRAVRHRARPRAARRLDDRGQGGPRAPDVGARRAG
jgi:aspartate/methionine/tyrosine aminotransferase